MRINEHQKAFKEKKLRERGDLGRKPKWLSVKIPAGKDYNYVKSLVVNNNLNTVCREARCPNTAECWSNRTATFMILGDTCTRSCGFCSVKVGMPVHLDLDEPRRVMESVKTLDLRHVVITSVNRDELKDGGANIFKETVRLINENVPGCTVEILIPDFKGYEPAFETIMLNPPDILNHNLETVPMLYHAVRPQAKYDRSLKLIRWFKDHGLRTKSGLMVGIGEKYDDVIKTMEDLHASGCDILTIGQYLQPTKNHLPVDRYVSLDEFAEYKKVGLDMGFLVVESGPLVRSSYHADKQARLMKDKEKAVGSE